MNAGSKGSASGPVSVVLPAALREQVAMEARRRGLKLSTTLRALVAERVEEIQESEQLTRAEEWQRGQAWATWEKVRAGDQSDVTPDDIDADFDASLVRVDRRSGPR